MHCCWLYLFECVLYRCIFMCNSEDTDRTKSQRERYLVGYTQELPCVLHQLTLIMGHAVQCLWSTTCWVVRCWSPVWYRWETSAYFRLEKNIQQMLNYWRWQFPVLEKWLDKDWDNKYRRMMQVKDSPRRDYACPIPCSYVSWESHPLQEESASMSVRNSCSLIPPTLISSGEWVCYVLHYSRLRWGRMT